MASLNWLNGSSSPSVDVDVRPAFDWQTWASMDCCAVGLLLCRFFWIMCTFTFGSSYCILLALHMGSLWGNVFARCRRLTIHQKQQSTALNFATNERFYVGGISNGSLLFSPFRCHNLSTCAEWSENYHVLLIVNWSILCGKRIESRVSQV